MNRLCARTCTVAVALLSMCAQRRASADEPLGHRPTRWTENVAAGPSVSAFRSAAMKFGDGYRRFLDGHRTEREVVRYALDGARRRGFSDLFATRRPQAAAGARLFGAAHDKLVALVVVGSEPLERGLHLVAAHVDSVRIDLKQKPLYADGNLSLLQTHYYGGIKRYQWLSQPLQLRGLVVDKSGKRVEVAIGDQPGEPVLVIPDLAVHISGPVDGEEGEEVTGERLDPIVASTPRSGGAGDRFVAEAARLLKSELGIDVGDLVSAELELVPAAPARDVGLDRALVGGYGQDDRACTYAALRAILSVERPRHTAVVLLADREEVGSSGNTGARSTFLRRVVAELLEARGTRSTEAAVHAVLAASTVVSADVVGGVNPLYSELYEPQNAAFLGSGVVWDQTGAHAELLAYVRDLFAASGVMNQPANWGVVRSSKSDSGTILAFFTRYGMRGLEVSIPILSMHSPYELVSKADLYEGYRAYRAFLSD